MVLDLGQGLDLTGAMVRHRQLQLGCGIIAPFVATRIRHNVGWQTLDVAGAAVDQDRVTEMRRWLGLDFDLTGGLLDQQTGTDRFQADDGTVNLTETEVMNLLVFYQNYDAAMRFIDASPQSTGDDWRQQPHPIGDLDTSWVFISSLDGVQRRIGSSLVEAADGAAMGNVISSEVQYAIMNADGSASNGSHWVLVAWKFEAR